MIIRPATPEELAAPKYDRRRSNPGRTPLVSLNDWKPGAVLDVSGRTEKGVRRSVMDGARKRGWDFREVSPGVFVRSPLWDVYRGDTLVRAGVVGINANDAIWNLVGGGFDTAVYSAVLQE